MKDVAASIVALLIGRKSKTILSAIYPDLDEDAIGVIQRKVFHLACHCKNCKERREIGTTREYNNYD